MANHIENAFSKGPSAEDPGGPAIKSGQGGWREWLRFLRIIFLSTILPFLLLLGALEWLGWSIGETYTTGALMRELQKYPNMSWMGERVQAHARMKLGQVAAQRPDVLIMGHSRLARVRASMFAPCSCYILARVSWPFGTLSDLLRQLPADYHPKLIIFNVDFWMFSPRYTVEYIHKAPVFDESIRENLIEIDNVAEAVFQHPDLIWKRSYEGVPARGIAAIETHVAFLRDGSERPPPPPLFATETSSTNNFIEWVRPINWKEDVYPAPAMGQAEMDALKQFVELGHKMGIAMVGVQMPIYGPALRDLEKDPNYKILGDFQRHVAAGYFKQIGLPFFDYSTFLPYTEDHRYFYDLIHPGGPLSEAVLASLFSDPQIHAILPNVEVSRLEQQVQADRTAAQHLESPAGDE